MEGVLEGESQRPALRGVRVPGAAVLGRHLEGPSDTTPGG